MGADMRKVYLDNAATTPLLPEVREVMVPLLLEFQGKIPVLFDNIGEEV